MYVVAEDGTGVRRVVEQPVMITGNVSPDGRWITGWSGVEAAGWQAFPLHGGAPRMLGNTRNATAWEWSARGDAMVFRSDAGDSTYFVPLAAGEMFPPFPREGLHTEQDVTALPGARRSRGAPCRGHRRMSTPSIGRPSSGISIAFRSGSGLAEKAASLIGVRFSRSRARTPS